MSEGVEQKSESVLPSPSTILSPVSSSKKSSSHKVHRGGKGPRRHSHGFTSTSALRESLQAFGDDVIKIKDPHSPHLIPQMALVDESLGGSVNPSFISSEFDVFSGREGRGIRHGGGEGIRFERIPSDEVGVRSTRWKKALVAGLLSSRASKKESTSGSGSADAEFHEIPEADRKPPFWGVRVELRSKFSLLNLQLILHEIACFTSCILLGCLIVKALEVITSVSTNPISDKNEWNFSRLYGSLQSLLLLFTSLGFLIRVNTLKTSSLLTMPLLVIPVILLVSTEYLNKAWDLQKHECLNYFKMGEASKGKVYLTQDCNAWKVQEAQASPSPIEIFTRLCPAIVAFFMSLFLFAYRNSFYLINQFATKQTPPVLQK